MFVQKNCTWIHSLISLYPLIFAIRYYFIVSTNWYILLHTFIFPLIIRILFIVSKIIFVLLVTPLFPNLQTHFNTVYRIILIFAIILLNFLIIFLYWNYWSLIEHKLKISFRFNSCSYNINQTFSKYTPSLSLTIQWKFQKIIHN